MTKKAMIIGEAEPMTLNLCSKIKYVSVASSLRLSRFFLNLAGPSARNILKRHVITMDVELALWHTEQDYWDYAAGLKKEKG